MFASSYLVLIDSLLFKLYRRSVWRHSGVLLCKSAEVACGRVSFRRLLVRYCQTETAEVASSTVRPGDIFHQNRVIWPFIKQHLCSILIWNCNGCVTIVTYLHRHHAVFYTAFIFIMLSDHASIHNPTHHLLIGCLPFFFFFLTGKQL